MADFKIITVTELPELIASGKVQLVDVRARYGEAKPSGAGVPASHLLPQSAGYASNVSEVRTDAEIARGRISGAICLPLHLLPLRLSELDANKPTVFYCQVGARSAQAAAFAAAQCHADVFNLQGGITAWARADGEIVA